MSDPFQLLVESVLDYAIFMIDPSGCVLSWNPGAERIYGYKAEEIVSRHISVFYPGGDLDKPAAELDLSQVREGGRYEKECVRVRKDGSRFWAVTTTSSLTDATGRHVGYAKVTRDITERKNVLDKLRSERNLSNSILSSLPGVFYVCDEAGKFIRWNREVERATGYNAAEIQAAHPLDFFVGADKARVAERIDEVFRLGSSSVEAAFVSKDGRATSYYFTGVRAEVNEKPCLLGMGIDLSSLRNAQAEAAAFREKLNVLIAYAPAALAMLDRSMRYVVVSDRWLSDHDLTSDEVVGKSHFDLFPDITPEWKGIYERALAGETITHEEQSQDRTGGDTQWLKWEVRPWYETPNGVIGGIVMLSEDITEQKRAAEALRKSEARFRAIVETEPECVKLLDMDGNLLEMNAAGLKMIEADDFAEVESKCIYSLVDPNDRNNFRQFNDRVFRGESGSLEFRIVGLKGGKRWLETHASPLYDEDGAVIATLGVTRDITNRKQSDQALRESEAKFRITFEKAAFAAALLRVADGRIASVNDKFVELVGYSREEVLDRTVAELDICSEERHKELVDEFLATGGSRDQELRLRARSGEEKIVLITCNSVEIGGERYVLSAATDITEAKQAQEALAQSEVQLRMALDAARIGTFDWDVPNDHITWSRWHEELWGFSPGEFGRTYEAFASRIHPDDLPDINAEVERCISERSRFSAEFRVVWPDGSVHWINGMGEFEFCADGKPLRMRGVVVGITDRKIAEQVLADRATLASLNAEVGLSLRRTTDLREMLCGCAEAIVRNLGVASAHIWTLDRANTELTLQASVGLQIEADDDRVPVGETVVGRIAAERRPFHTNSALTDPVMGSNGWAHGNDLKSFAGYPLGVDDRVVGVAAVYAKEPLSDVVVTALAAVADALAVGIERKRSELLLESVVNNVTDGLVSIDEKGVIHSFNTSAATMFGYSEAEVIGRNVKILMGEPFHSQHDQYLANYLRTGQAKVIGLGRRVEGRRKDGKIFPIQISVREFAVDGNRHFSGVIRDTTKERELEDQLRQAQKMEAIGQLAGGIAHDFNNVLTVILGYTDILLRTLPEDDPKARSVGMIHEAGKRAASLTEQLLAFSRRAVIRPAELDLNVAVTEAEQLLTRLIGENIDFQIVLHPEPLTITADPGQLGQVLLNLAVNGRDAMPAGGMLTIETFAAEIDEEYAQLHPYATPGSYAVVAVTDSGHGMTAETKARIFEPFFTTKGLGKGTGLGLATIYGIVKQAGGYIDVYSEVNKGTTFKVYFPIAKGAVPDEGPVPTNGTTEVIGGSETILIVEDEKMVRELAAETLSGLGYRVLSAADAIEARKIAGEEAIDLLFTDVVMPGPSGNELAQTLTSVHPGLKVLFASGYTDDAVVRHGLTDRGSNFLQKPYSPSALARRVREIIDGISRTE